MKSRDQFFSKHYRIIFLFIVYFAFVSAVCIIFKLHFIFSTLLFIVVPTAILMMLNRNKNSIKEFTLFCFSLGVPMGLYSQIIAERNNLWHYNPSFESFYAFNMPLEAVFWYPAWFGLVIATYLYFFDQHKHIFKKDFLHRHFKYFLFTFFLMLFSLFLIQVDKEYLTFQFPYLTVLLPLILLSLIIFFVRKHNHFAKIFVPTVLFLFVPMFLYDIIGVYSGQWTFPGPYLFQMDFYFAKLPVEEFIIWLFIWPASVIAYFEEFEYE